jgi:hypothetical protein
MRTHMKFIVTGKSKEELESKIKERVAKYLSTEADSVESMADMEMYVNVGEEGPLDLTFVAECNVRLKQ